MNRGLIEEVIKISDVVTSTMGAKGRTVILRNKDFGFFSTKDGYNVLKNYKPSTPVSLEAVALEILKQSAEKTAEKAGDGTTTTIAIASDFLKISEDEDFIVALTQAEEGYKKAMSLLDKLSVGADDDKLEKATIISANNNKEVGLMVSELAKKVGGNGAIYIKEAVDSNDVTVEYTSGYLTEQAPASMYYLEGKNEVQVYNPAIVTVDYVFNDQRDLIHLYRSYKKAFPQKDKVLVLCCRGITGSAYEMLMKNFLDAKIPLIAFESKVPGEIEDVSAISGSKFISPNLGDKIREVTPESIGQVDSIVYSKSSCNYLYSKDISEYAQKVSDKDRKAKLEGGVATVFVGGPTAITRFERAQLIEDAKYTALNTIMDGKLFVGGGYTLWKLGKQVGGLYGGALQSVALKPYLNAGHTEQDYIIDLFESGKILNIKNGDIEDVDSCSVYDSYGSLVEALRNSLGAIVELVKVKHINI